MNSIRKIREGLRWKENFPSDGREGTINQGHEIDHNGGHDYDT